MYFFKIQKKKKIKRNTFYKKMERKKCLKVKPLNKKSGELFYKNQILKKKCTFLKIQKKSI